MSEPFPMPSADDSELTAILGTKGYTDDESLGQFAAWGDRTGLFELLGKRGQATFDEIVASTQLNEAGADALLGVLVCLKLVLRGPEGFSLPDLSRVYLLRDSPYYAGPSLFVNCRKPVPPEFVKHGSRPGVLRSALGRFAKKLKGWDFGGRKMLENQHSRNLPACVAAGKTEVVAGLQCIVDVAGGTGTFAVPLALRDPGKRIVLTDLPRALDGIRGFLARHGVEDRIELIGMDVFVEPWPIPECDGIFFGNFIHGFSDEKCLFLCRQSFKKLKPGGKILLHELVWNDNKDGPLKTALFNVTMKSFGGAQRTVAELQALLKEAGFVDPFAVPTSGGFMIVGAARP